MLCLSTIGRPTNDQCRILKSKCPVPFLHDNFTSITKLNMNPANVIRQLLHKYLIQMLPRSYKESENWISNSLNTQFQKDD